MRKNRSKKILLVGLISVAILGMCSTVNAGGNSKSYFIATEGITDPESNYHHFVDTWTGNGLEERIIGHEWYANYNGNIVSASSQGFKLGGLKAVFKIYEEGNDIFFYMRIYKGGSSSPKISETIVWQIINGKDSTNDRITCVLMNTESGKISKTVTLYIGEEETITVPFSLSYSCRMWLM